MKDRVLRREQAHISGLLCMHRDVMHRTHKFKSDSLFRVCPQISSHMRCAVTSGCERVGYRRQAADDEAT